MGNFLEESNEILVSAVNLLYEKKSKPKKKGKKKAPFCEPTGKGDECEIPKLGLTGKWRYLAHNDVFFSKEFPKENPIFMPGKKFDLGAAKDRRNAYSSPSNTRTHEHGDMSKKSGKKSIIARIRDAISSLKSKKK